MNKNRCIGRSARWTKEEIARRARITTEDVNAARAFARRLLPKKFKNLLEKK